MISRRWLHGGLLVAFVVLGLAAAGEVKPPWNWALAAVLMAVVGVGTSRLLPERVVGRQPTVGLLPALLVLAAFSVLSQPWVAEEPPTFAGAVVTGLLMGGTLLARSMEPGHRFYPWGRRTVSAVAFLTAFAMYSVVYTTKVRSFFTATAIALLTVLIAFDLYDAPFRDLTQTGLYAAVTGLVVGQITWVLNYWVIGGLTGGAFLLLGLYACAGVVRGYLGQRLTTRLALEYGVVLMVGFLLVAALVSSQPTI